MKNGLPKDNGKSFQKDIFNLIERHNRNSYCLVIPTQLINFTGDLKIAAFLSHLVYWTGKGKARDGFIFKSAREWKQETGLKKHTVDNARKKLKKLGVLQTKTKRARGAPTIHYRLKEAELSNQLSKFLSGNSSGAHQDDNKNEMRSVEPTSKLKRQNMFPAKTMPRTNCSNYSMEVQLRIQTKQDQWRRTMTMVFFKQSTGEQNDASFKKLTPLKAIRGRCTDCSGFELKEVRNCQHLDCPLYPLRMGKGSRSTLNRIRVHCLLCCNNQRDGVRLCPSEKCPLWEYRFGKRPGGNGNGQSC